MYLCIYVSMYLCIYASMYLCIYVSVYLCLSACLSVCLSVSVCVCVAGSQKCCKDLANMRLDLRNAANSFQIEGKGLLPGGEGWEHGTHHHIYIFIYIKYYIIIVFLLEQEQKMKKNKNESNKSISIFLVEHDFWNTFGISWRGSVGPLFLFWSCWKNMMSSHSCQNNHPLYNGRDPYLDNPKSSSMLEFVAMLKSSPTASQI